jgi:hypothetical protein
MAFERARSVGVALLLVLLTTPAWAAPSESQKEAARNLMAEGRELREQRDLAGALSRFQMADAIMGVPTTGYEVAATQAELGQLEEARVTLRKLLSREAAPDEPAPFKLARGKAAELDAELAARLTPQPAAPVGAAVTETAAAPAPATAKPPAPEPTREPERPAAPPPASDSAVPPLAYVGGGVALAGLVIGSVTGSMALSKKHAAERGCVDHRCPPATWDDLDSAGHFATASTVSFVLCGLGAAVAVGALVFGRERDTVQSSLTVVAHPRRLDVTGRF